MSVDLESLVISLQVASLATIACAVLGISFATLLAKKRFIGRDLLDSLFTAPMVLPPTVLGYYLLSALGRKSVIGAAYESVFGSTIVFSQFGLVCAATVGALPLVVKSGRAALEGVDPTLVLAARTLGASAPRAFFTVELPLAARGLVAGIMLAFARALGDFGITLMIGGNIPHVTKTASLSIYDSVVAQRETEATGMVLILSAVAIGLVYAVNKLMASPGNAH